MKIFSTAWLCLAVLFLSGCSVPTADANQRAVTLRGGYLAAPMIAVQCTLTADYGQRVYDFGFDGVYTTEKTTLTLTAPETIQGLVVEVTDDGTALHCDGMMVETGALSPTGLTPITALPAILDGLSTAYIQQCTLEEGELTLYCGDPDTPAGAGEEFIFVLDDATGDLKTADILVDGTAVIHCTIDNISWGAAALQSETE